MTSTKLWVQWKRYLILFLLLFISWIRMRAFLFLDLNYNPTNSIQSQIVDSGLLSSNRYLHIKHLRSSHSYGLFINPNRPAALALSPLSSSSINWIHFMAQAQSKGANSFSTAKRSCCSFTELYKCTYMMIQSFYFIYLFIFVSFHSLISINCQRTIWEFQGFKGLHKIGIPSNQTLSSSQKRQKVHTLATGLWFGRKHKGNVKTHSGKNWIFAVSSCSCGSFDGGQT